MTTTKPKPTKGFASMDPQRQREIASMGGQAAHASGRAHQFTSEEARAAGKKKGQAALLLKYPPPQNPPTGAKP